MSNNQQELEINLQQQANRQKSLNEAIKRSVKATEILVENAVKETHILKPIEEKRFSDLSSESKALERFNLGIQIINGSANPYLFSRVGDQWTALYTQWGQKKVKDRTPAEIHILTTNMSRLNAILLEIGIRQSTLNFLNDLSKLEELVHKRYPDQPKQQQELNNALQQVRKLHSMVKSFGRFGHLTAAQLAVVADTIAVIKEQLQQTLDALPKIDANLPATNSTLLRKCLSEKLEEINKLSAEVIVCMKRHIENDIANTKDERVVSPAANNERKNKENIEDINNSTLGTSFLNIQLGSHDLTGDLTFTLQQVFPGVNLPIAQDKSLHGPIPRFILHKQEGKMDGNVDQYFCAYIYQHGGETWLKQIGINLSQYQTFRDVLIKRAKQVQEFFIPNLENPYIGLLYDIVTPIKDTFNTLYGIGKEFIDSMRGNWVAITINQKIASIQQNQNIQGIQEDLIHRKEAILQTIGVLVSQMGDAINAARHKVETTQENYRNASEYRKELEKHQKELEEISRGVEGLSNGWVSIDDEENDPGIGLIDGLNKMRREMDEELAKQNPLKNDFVNLVIPPVSCSGSSKSESPKVNIVHVPVHLSVIEENEKQPVVSEVEQKKMEEKQKEQQNICDIYANRLQSLRLDLGVLIERMKNAKGCGAFTRSSGFIDFVKNVTRSRNISGNEAIVNELNKLIDGALTQINNEEVTDKLTVIKQFDEDFKNVINEHIDELELKEKTSCFCSGYLFRSEMKRHLLNLKNNTEEPWNIEDKNNLSEPHENVPGEKSPLLSEVSSQ